MRVPAVCLLALILISTPAARGVQAGPDRNPFQGDVRLQRIVTIRVSRMPIADLLQRLDRELGARLGAEGDDVADQKIDLFTHGKPVTAAEVLTALADLLNSEAPPHSFHWERLGPAPRFRYTLVRDVASRQWEARQAADAAARMPHVLRQRFAELGREPFRPERAGIAELPSFRKLLPLLTQEQFDRLCADRYVPLRPADWTEAQKELYPRLVQELIAANYRRDPQVTQEALNRYRSPDEYPNPHMEVLIRGEAPRYIIEVGVGGPSPLSQLGHVGDAEDTAVLKDTRTPGPALPILDPDPALALPPRPPAPRGNVRADTSHEPWLMGEILADIAARSRINLIADDYTCLWPGLSRFGGPRPLSAWLALIRDTYSIAVARQGKFTRLRNRAWHLDRRYEVPSPDVARWRQMLRGTNADRLRVLVEIAQRTPVSTVYPRITWDRLRILDEYPELTWTSRQQGGRTVSSFFGVVANRHLELLLYSRMPAERQREALGSGLTISWAETPADLQQLYRRFASRIQERDPQAFGSQRIVIRYEGDRLQIVREVPTLNIRDAMEVILPAEPADDPRQLVGKLIPELEVQQASGSSVTLRPRGPVLLYVAPAWPRPVVVSEERFADLKALEQLDPAQVQLLSTEATAAELRDWWKERGLTQVPIALSPTSAQKLGIRHRPLAIVLDRTGRVTWVKEGFEAGDEAEWQRQVAHAGS